jgi:glycosyltransferase involved in cell wall biosynthesis
MPEPPTVSIVTVSLNQGRYLERALRSVLEQDHPAVEYVVMDGGSTDGSVETLRRHERRLHSWFSGPDGGPAAALNAGFARTKGEICGYVNADDFLLPGAVTRVVEAFSHHPERDVVYGDGFLVDAAERVLRPVFSDPWSLRRFAFGGCLVLQQATFFRRSAFERAGGFREENRTCWDGELLADMALAGARFRHVPEALGAFRLHPESISGSRRLADLYPGDSRRIFRKIVGRDPSTLDRIRFAAWRALRLPYQLRRSLLRRLPHRTPPPRESAAAPRPAGGAVAWVGAHPSHYVKGLHRRIEETYGATVAFFYMPPTPQERMERRYEVGDLPRRSLVLSAPDPVRQTMQLLRALRKAEPSLLVVAGHFPLSVLAASLWARATGRAVCYWSDINLQDVLREGPLRQRLRRALMGPHLRAMARLLYTGTQNRRFYEWCCGSEGLPPLHRLPYPHDPEPFGQSETLREASRAELAGGAELVVLYVGRLVEDKGVDLLLRGVALLPADLRARMRCLIAGNGGLRPRLEALAATLRVGAVVSFLGEQPSDRTPALYAAADVVVVPSRREPWGLVVNEALSSRRPVIAPAWVGAVADLVEDGVTGFVFRDSSPAAIAEALERAFALRASLSLMGRRGQQLVQEEGWTLSAALESWDRLMAVDAAVSHRSRRVGL